MKKKRKPAARVDTRMIDPSDLKIVPDEDDDHNRRDPVWKEFGLIKVRLEDGDEVVSQIR
jgi:hypothetical protein